MKKIIDLTAGGGEIKRDAPRMKSTNESIRELIEDGKMREKTAVKALRFGGDFQGVVSAIESTLSNAVSAYKDEDLAGTVAAVEMAQEQISDLLDIVSEGAEGVE